MIELADTVGHRHRVGRECARVVGEGEAGEAGGEIPHAGAEHRARQRTAGREDAEAEHDLPKPRQHPQALRRKSVEHDREQHARHAGRNELLGRRMDHLVGQAGVDAPRARDHLDADQDDADDGGRDPQGEVGEDVGRGVGQPQRLHPGGGDRQHAGRRNGHRTIAAKLGAARHLTSDRRDVGQRLVQVSHAQPAASFTVQSTLRCKSASRAFDNARSHAGGERLCAYRRSDRRGRSRPACRHRACGWPAPSSADRR